jgi:hypothetical protein
MLGERLQPQADRGSRKGYPDGEEGISSSKSAPNPARRGFCCQTWRIAHLDAAFLGGTAKACKKLTDSRDSFLPKSRLCVFIDGVGEKNRISDRPVLGSIREPFA